MTPQNTVLATILLPEEIAFEVPRDYAQYCGGRPLRLLSVTNVDSNLTIQVDIDIVRFVHCSTAIEIDRESILGFIVNDSELISGMEACTLRVGLVEKDGNKITLPIMSASTAARSVFLKMVANLSSCVPLSIFSSPESMLRAK